MNPLLLLLLLGGGAVVAKKIYDARTCPKDPPPNPFFQNGQIDWDALQKAWGDVRSGSAKANGYLMGLAAIAKNVPVYDTFVALAAVAVAKINDWIAGNDNSDEYKKKAEASSLELVKRGFIPPRPYEGATLKNLSNQANSQLYAIEFADPYVRTLCLSAGALFNKWGGTADTMEAGLAFLVGDQKDGTAPDSFGLAQHNLPKLRVAAFSVAHEYGVCSSVDAVYASMVEGCMNFTRDYPWIAFNKGQNLQISGDPASLEYQRVAADPLTGLVELEDSRYTVDPSANTGFATPASSSSTSHSFVKQPSTIKSTPMAMAFASGMRAGIAKAASLAGRPTPPIFDPSGIDQPNGVPLHQAVHRQVAGSASGAVKAGSLLVPAVQKQVDQAALDKGRSDGLPGWGSGTWAK